MFLPTLGVVNVTNFFQKVGFSSSVLLTQFLISSCCLQCYVLLRLEEETWWISDFKSVFTINLTKGSWCGKQCKHELRFFRHLEMRRVCSVKSTALRPLLEFSESDLILIYRQMKYLKVI